MCRNAGLRTLYREFFRWMGRTELFRAGPNSSLEQADLFPLIYLGILLEGTPDRYGAVRHLLIDEMQDYTPVQYAVTARLFRCEKTILGDVSQSVSPFSASSADMISRVFREGDCVKLCKSYRSSYEITRFAQAISPNEDLVPIERHGEEPQVLAFDSRKGELGHIGQVIEAFSGQGFRTMGIICKTQKQAEQLYHALEGASTKVHLLTPESVTFEEGVVVCSAHMAKGLEFDQVVLPEASAGNYSTRLDKNLLYVACTRAMHRLTVTCSGEITPLIPGADPEQAMVAGSRT